MTSQLPPLTQALTGALASASASALTYPLDFLAARVQTQTPRDVQRTGSGIEGAVKLLRKMVRKHGWESLYAGLVSDTGATLVSNFFYFYAYSWLRQLLLKLKARAKGRQAALTVPTELALGFVAGVASRALSTPLSVITVQMQTARSNAKQRDIETGEKRPESPSSDSDEEDEPVTVTGLVKRLYAEEGLSGFWRGFESTVPLCLNPSITFGLFQVFRRFTARMSRSKSMTITPGPIEAFLGAAISNSVAVALLYPLILAKTQAQASARRNGDGSKPSVKGVFGQVLRQKNSSLGIYHGLETQLLKGFLSQGASFLLKERIELLLLLVLAHKRAATA